MSQNGNPATQNVSQASFGSPNTATTLAMLYSGATDTFYLCQKCSVLYDSTAPTSVCAASGNHVPVQSSNTQIPYKFILPYNKIPQEGWQNSPNPPTGVSDLGCAEICGQCSIVVPQNPFYQCPGVSSGPHSLTGIDSLLCAYWIYTRSQANNSSSPFFTISEILTTWYECSYCGGLYYSGSAFQGNSITNTCKNATKSHTMTENANFDLLVCNNITFNANTTGQSTQLYLNGWTGQGTVDLQANYSQTESGVCWEIEQPDMSQGDYILKCLGSYSNPTYTYLNASTNVQLAATPQTWNIININGLYNIQTAIEGVPYYLIGTLNVTSTRSGSVTLNETQPSAGKWEISILS